MASLNSKQGGTFHPYATKKTYLSLNTRKQIEPPQIDDSNMQLIFFGGFQKTWDIILCPSRSDTILGGSSHLVISA